NIETARPKGMAIIAESRVTIIDPTIIGAIPKYGGLAVGDHSVPVIKSIRPYSKIKLIPDLKIKKVISIIRKIAIIADTKKTSSPIFSFLLFIFLALLYFLYRPYILT